jgi:hypothetical protein
VGSRKAIKGANRLPVPLPDCERVKMHPGQYLLVSHACLGFAAIRLVGLIEPTPEKARNALNEDKHEPETDVRAGALKGRL